MQKVKNMFTKTHLNADITTFYTTQKEMRSMQKQSSCKTNGAALKVWVKKL